MQLPTPMPVDPFNEDYTLSQSTRLHGQVFGHTNSLKESITAERLAGHENAFRFPMDYTLGIQAKRYKKLGKLIAKLAETDRKQTRQAIVIVSFAVISTLAFIIAGLLGAIQ